MTVRTWIGDRKVKWSIAGTVAVVALVALAYAAGVGASATLEGVELVRGEDGTVRVTLFGVGVGSTREEVDASPLGPATVYRDDQLWLSRLPGDDGTRLEATPEFDADGRVSRLTFNYEGNWLSVRRVATRARSLFRSVGGLCRWQGCLADVAGDQIALSATLATFQPGVTGFAVLR